MDINSFDPEKIESFAQITEWREFEKEVERKSRNNIKGLLVEIYEKPTHFIYELLQNADDAGARNVSFELLDDKLLFFHDGTKDFSLKDVYGITAIGYKDSEKRKSKKGIGKFGVGFKSVFAVTKTPYIYNRAYNFRIEDFTIPYEEPRINLGAYTTLVKVPFTKTDKFPKATIVKRIIGEFDKIDAATIMFLNTVESVSIRYKDEGMRKIELNRKRSQGYEVITDTSNPNKNYLSFKDKKTHTSIVFKSDGNRILKIWSPKVYSFLPTDVNSELSFYVDAPFDLKINRGMIDFEEKKNQELISNIEDLYSKALEKLKKAGFIDQDFLNEILPIDRDICGRSEIYDALYERTKCLMLSASLLPTISGEHINAGNGLLYSDRDMPELLKRGVSWFDINTSATVIRKFLTSELGVKSLGIVDFSRIIAKKLNSNTSKEWLYKYYELCSEKVENWQVAYSLRFLPIIKTRNGKFRSAYNENGEEQLFRPSKGLQPSQVINSLFMDIKDKNRQDRINHLLNYLRIGARTPAQTIQKTILAKWERYTEEEKISKFFEINDLYNNLYGDSKEGVKKLLKDQPIFRCTVNGRAEWDSASNILVGTKDQRLLYEKRNIPILDRKFYKKNKTIGEEVIKGSEDLCNDLGIIKGFPLFESKYYYDYSSNTGLDRKTKNKYNIPTDYYEYWWSKQEKRILYLEDILKELKTPQQTAAIVKLLSMIGNRETFKEIVAGCTYRGRAPHDPREIPAYFIRSLNDAKWIVNGDKRCATSNIPKTDFIKRYKLSGHELFLEWLDFVPEAIKQLPHDQQEFHKLFTSLPPDKQKKYLQEMQAEIDSANREQFESNKGEIDTRTIDIEADFPALAGQLVIKDDTLEELHEEDIIGNNNDGNNQKSETASAEVKTSVKTPAKNNNANGPMEQKYKKLLGNQGEKRVMELLIEEFGEDCVKEYCGNNKGYDFKIEKDGEDIYYIEAKTFSSDGHIEISPSQWNYAKVKRKAYIIYIVDANTGNYRKLKDPYGQYLENKINVDVVGFWYKES